MAAAGMGEEDPEQVGSELSEEAPSGGLADTIAEAAIALTTGAPPQIQRSFFKVVNRVFIAGAEWPANYLEGKAKVTAARAKVESARYEAEAADILSQQKARDVINRGTAKAAVEQFANPDMAQRAAEFHAAHILREQANREDVVKLAAEDLQNNPPQSDSHSEIDDDWVHAFFREAATRSSEEYKVMFGRILSGEIRSPGTFSISTIETFARLNKETAHIFHTACNLSSNFFGFVRIICQPFANAGDNGLRPFGLTYDNLARLVEAGLIRSDFNEQNNVPPEIYRDGLLFEHAGAQAFIKLADTESAKNYSATIGFAGPAFTIAGKELRSITTMTSSNDYLKAFAGWLGTQHMELYRNIKSGGAQLFGEKVEP